MAATYTLGIPLSKDPLAAERFKEMYERGCSLQDIGAALGCTRARANQLRIIYKLPPREVPGRSKEISDKIAMRTAARNAAYLPRKLEAMWFSARTRAKQSNLPFDITIDDIETPERCPILGYVLDYQGNGGDNAASLDRIIPERGYVKGNIATISWRANNLKRDGTLDEFLKIAEWLLEKS